MIAEDFENRWAPYIVIQRNGIKRLYQYESQYKPQPIKIEPHISEKSNINNEQNDNVETERAFIFGPLYYTEDDIFNGRIGHPLSQLDQQETDTALLNQHEQTATFRVIVQEPILRTNQETAATVEERYNWHASRIQRTVIIKSIIFGVGIALIILGVYLSFKPPFDSDAVNIMTIIATYLAGAGMCTATYLIDKYLIPIDQDFLDFFGNTLRQLS